MTDKQSHKMPQEIFAYKCTKGINMGTGKTEEIGYHGTGTWIDFDDSCKGDEATRYVLPPADPLKELTELGQEMGAYDPPFDNPLVKPIDVEILKGEIVKLLVCPDEDSYQRHHDQALVRKTISTLNQRGLIAQGEEVDLEGVKSALVKEAASCIRGDGLPSDFQEDHVRKCPVWVLRLFSELKDKDRLRGIRLKSISDNLPPKITKPNKEK